MFSSSPLPVSCPKANSQQPTATFLVLFPAYHEDTVIVNSVEAFLRQNYPQEQYQVVVISDHMREETNTRLSALPITLLQPAFEKSSKAKALQYAIHSPSAIHQPIFDYVVILDADNIVAPDFLTRLSQIACKQEAIQCHRTAKNAHRFWHVLRLRVVQGECQSSGLRCRGSLTRGSTAPSAHLHPLCRGHLCDGRESQQ